MSKVFLLEKSKTLKTNFKNGINLCKKKKSKANLQKLAKTSILQPESEDGHARSRHWLQLISKLRD